MAIKSVTLLLFCFWVVSSSTAGGEFFSSTDKLLKLAECENKLLELFSEYIEHEEANIFHMKHVLQNLQQNLVYNQEKILRDPVAAFQLLRRFNKEWQAIDESTRRSLYQVSEFQNYLRSIQISETYEVDEAASGLIRLQEIYMLSPENITKETPLSYLDAFYIGWIAYEEQKFQFAFLWFLYCLNRESADEKLLLQYLSYSAYNFGSIPLAIDYGQKLLNLDPGNDKIRLQLIRYKFSPKPTPAADIFTLIPNPQDSYGALCRGDFNQTTFKKQMALSCRYSTGGGNPRLMYAPVKEEEEWDKPLIIRYHDIVSDREIEILKKISAPNLSRAEVFSKERVSKYRTAQSVFLTEDYPVVADINQRIADITGLSMDSAEDLQVQNYGIGGRYEPHYDDWRFEDEDGTLREMRIATFLLYMSDVDMGGATAFTTIGVAVKPKKGSAVFWYNLHKNGQVDMKTLHAGCPVVLGNKWVANKWIHDFGQEFRRPCSLLESN